MRRLALAAAAVTVALVPALGAAPQAEPGVTPTSVKLGGTVPLSGEAAAFGSVAVGAKAFFDDVNAHGGVHGRRIEYVWYDDGYDPAQTVQLTRRLVEQEGVFAIFNSIGTDQNAAVRPYLNQLGVPQLFVGDGSQGVNDARRHPWTLGFLQSYLGEGAVYGRHLARTARRARIAVLYENTPFGRELAAGLERAIRGKGPRVVAKQSYEYTDADVAAQVARLKASGATTFMIFATPKFAIQAFVAAHKLGWRPQVYAASVSIEPGIMAIARSNAPELTRGALSIAFLKNPNDPVWAKDPATRLYRRIMARWAPSARVADVYTWYGMAVAWTMVETLRRAGPNLTRASLMRAARTLDLTGNPFLLPGIALRTTPSGSFPIGQVYLYRYDNRQWVRASGLLSARA